MVKTAKNRKLKKIIAGVAATTMVIAAGSALAVSATTNYYTFDPTVGFNTNIGNGQNIYQTTRLEPYAYNTFTIPANVSAKSYVRISCAQGGDTKATNNYAAANSARTVTSDRVVAAGLTPYSMNMSVTRGNQQVDNYYTAQ